MRVFFALPLSDGEQSQIDRWRLQCLPPFDRPVETGNLHVTLVFLGELDQRQVQAVITDAEAVSVPDFELTLDSFGYWPRQEICFLAPSAGPPAALIQLVSRLKGIAGRHGLRVERRRYRPHVTLARRCAASPPEPLIQPDISIRVGQFTLCESVRVRGGVHYEPIAGYPLPVTGSPEEHD